MNEISIQDKIQMMLPPTAGVNPPKEAQGNSFSDTLNGALGEVNRLHEEADRAVTALSSGKETDIHNTMIALEKAEINFKLMMQVRNKIISAYETIMRTSI